MREATVVSAECRFGDGSNRSVAAFEASVTGHALGVSASSKRFVGDGVRGSC